MDGFAWVTLATNDSYSLGALVLAHSLKKTGTAHQLAVLVTPGVTQSMRDKLSAVFNVVQKVDILDSKDTVNLRLLKRPELGITFTKLHCWRLTQYKKCVFLDADTLVLQNVDDLFEREEFSAAPDVGWPDCFNSGVFVYKPSNETYEKLVQFALDKGSFDGGDQGLLNLYFSDWAHKDISKHLPFIYNMCSTSCYSYLPAFKQFGSDVKIIHFISSTKPWLQFFDTVTGKVQPAPEMHHLKDVLQYWWDIFCSLIHPNLSSDMNRSGMPDESSSTLLQDIISTGHTLTLHPSIGNESFPTPCNYTNVWDPWEDYDHSKRIEAIQIETKQFDSGQIESKQFETQPIETRLVKTQQTESELKSINTLQTEMNLEHFNSHNTSNSNIPVASRLEISNNIISESIIPECPVDIQTPITHYVSSPNPTPIAFVYPISTNNEEPAIDCGPSVSNEKDTLITKDNKADETDDGGLAGAFAQFTLGSPRSPTQNVLEDHLRRQGWEAGNIDYMGTDSFDNIWSKICETLGSTPEGASAESEPATAETVVEQKVTTELAKPTETTKIIEDAGKQEPVKVQEPAKIVDEPKKEETVEAKAEIKIEDSVKTEPSLEILTASTEEIPKNVETVDSTKQPEITSSVETPVAPQSVECPLAKEGTTSPTTTDSLLTKEVCVKAEAASAKPEEAPLTTESALKVDISVKTEATHAAVATESAKTQSLGECPLPVDVCAKIEALAECPLPPDVCAKTKEVVQCPLPAAVCAKTEASAECPLTADVCAKTKEVIECPLPADVCAKTEASAECPLPADVCAKTKEVVESPLPVDVCAKIEALAQCPLPADVCAKTKEVVECPLPADVCPKTEALAQCPLPADVCAKTTEVVECPLPADVCAKSKGAAECPLPVDVCAKIETPTECPLPVDACAKPKEVVECSLPVDVSPKVEASIESPLASDICMKVVGETADISAKAEVAVCPAKIDVCEKIVGSTESPLPTDVTAKAEAAIECPLPADICAKPKEAAECPLPVDVCAKTALPTDVCTKTEATIDCPTTCKKVVEIKDSPLPADVCAEAKKAETCPLSDKAKTECPLPASVCAKAEEEAKCPLSAEVVAGIKSEVCAKVEATPELPTVGSTTETGEKVCAKKAGKDVCEAVPSTPTESEKAECPKPSEKLGTSGKSSKVADSKLTEAVAEGKAPEAATATAASSKPGKPEQAPKPPPRKSTGTKKPKPAK